jgi:hypothetical protein
MLNVGKTKLGNLIKLADPILFRTSCGITPNNIQSIYPTTMEIKIGTTPKNPLKYIVPIIAIPSVTIDINIHVPLDTPSSAGVENDEFSPDQFIATPAKLSPITITTEPTTTGDKILSNHLVPTNLIIKATITYISPAAIIPDSIELCPYNFVATDIGPINAKDEPTYAGSLAFVHKIYNSVPTPLQNSAIDGLRPVSIGTRIVAPTIANKCCKLNGIVSLIGNLSSTSTKFFI